MGISNASSGEHLLKQSGSCFCIKEDRRIRDCKEKKGCVYCKGLQNSDICKETDKKDDKNKEDPPSRITKTSATHHV